jgi:hypothetical protein
MISLFFLYLLKNIKNKKSPMYITLSKIIFLISFNNFNLKLAFEAPFSYLLFIYSIPFSEA